MQPASYNQSVSSAMAPVIVMGKKARSPNSFTLRFQYRTTRQAAFCVGARKKKGALLAYSKGTLEMRKDSLQFCDPHGVLASAL